MLLVYAVLAAASNIYVQCRSRVKSARMVSVYRVLIAISLTCLIYIAPVLAVSVGLLDKVEATLDSLVTLRKELDDSYQIYVNSEGAIAAAEAELAPVRQRIESLSDQLAVMDADIERAEAELADLQRETAGTEIGLHDLSELVETRSVELVQARRVLLEFIRLAAAEQEQYTDAATGEISTLKFLLSDSSLADAELQREYLLVLQGTAQQLISKLQSAQELYEESRGDLLVRRGKLISLQRDFLVRQHSLADLRASKEQLLTETKGQESEYERLLEQARVDQADALREIATLREDLDTINALLEKIAPEDAEEFAELLRDSGLPQTNGLSFPGHIPRLIWPVDPGRGITAVFHDREYEAMFGVLHNAIDYRARQGTVVRAAAPGVVYKVKDNGLRYSYIMLAHAGELQTVYGHMSKMLVREGDTVQAGQAIGLSGGSPGTRGAGLMTTGPHLHFEVFDHGEHRDPLDYLPLEHLRIKDVPAKYLN